MDKRIGTVLVLYGCFLVVCGLIGYELTRETSTSSLFNGGIFGALLIVLGLLRRQGRMWTHPASLSAVLIFALTFLWRSTVKWIETINGNEPSVSVAVLLTCMSVVSIAVALTLYREYRH